jgi:hypothetical protein
MTIEEVIEWVESTLETNTGKQLTSPEKQILKAAWLNETYSAIAESLYMSVGHIKDLAYLLWKRLSNLFGEKVTKHNFRRLFLERNAISTHVLQTIVENQICQIEDHKDNILIVDDQVENLLFLTKLLTKHGYKVRSFTSGKMALQSTQNSPPPILFY